MNVPRLRAPVVLVHGLFGFDRIAVAGTVLQYFPGVPEYLEAAGNRVFVPCLAPTGGVEQRAAQLKTYLERWVPDEPVHLFAHSMGGLDARYMISRLGMEKRVLTLTTLGTPHRGTFFADWGISALAWMVRPTLDFLDVPIQAFYDLTRRSCIRFNEATPNRPEVRYFSVAGRHDGRFTSPEWLLPYHVVRHAEGDNDGVVSIASATFGEDVVLWEGDHLALVNQRRTVCDPLVRYGELVRRLADEGF